MAHCTVCVAYMKAFNAYLEAMKGIRDPFDKDELDAHLKALSDISASREDHLISHAKLED